MFSLHLIEVQLISNVQQLYQIDGSNSLFTDEMGSESLVCKDDVYFASKLKFFNQLFSRKKYYSMWAIFIIKRAPV